MRAEPILATPVDRRSWLWSHPGASVIGSMVLMLSGGLMTGLGYYAVTGDPDQLLALTGSTSTMAKAGLIVLELFTAALFGLSACRSIFAWSSVALVLVVGLLAETLSLLQCVRNVSPLEHLLAMPAALFDLVPVMILLIVAVALEAFAVFDPDVAMSAERRVRAFAGQRSNTVRSPEKAHSRSTGTAWSSGARTLSASSRSDRLSGEGTKSDPAALSVTATSEPIETWNGTCPARWPSRRSHRTGAAPRE